MSNPNIRAITVGVGGFLISGTACLLLSRASDSTVTKPPIAHPQQLDETPAPQPLTVDTDRVRRLIGGDQSPDQLLSLADHSAQLPQKDRITLLTETLQLSEEERRLFLTMLVLGWAETDPMAAAEWCHQELEGIERLDLLREVATTWAHQDGTALGEWWAENMPKRELFSLGGPMSLPNILLQADPLAYAGYMELPQLATIGVDNMVTTEMIPNIEAIPRLAEQVVGRVGYQAIEEGQSLDRLGSGRHLKGKAGWNELFEAIAVVWHAQAPEAYEVWLSRFSPQAQAHARSKIDE